MSLHPWIDPDDIEPSVPTDVRNHGMAIVDDEGLMVPLDSDDQADRDLYAMVIGSHPVECCDNCPGLA
jgi:hypothetical protein